MERETNYLIIRMKAIERELQDLRRYLQPSAQKKTTKIEGLWKGIDITEEDLDKAERSLFKTAYGS